MLQRPRADSPDFRFGSIPDPGTRSETGLDGAEGRPLGRGRLLEANMEAELTPLIEPNRAVAPATEDLPRRAAQVVHDHVHGRLLAGAKPKLGERGDTC